MLTANYELLFIAQNRAENLQKTSKKFCKLTTRAAISLRTSEDLGWSSQVKPSSPVNSCAFFVWIIGLRSIPTNSQPVRMSIHRVQPSSSTCF